MLPISGPGGNFEIISVQDLCKIMKSVIYSLSKFRRLLSFPYPVDEIGLMTDHFVLHKNHRINRYFICFTFHKELYNPPEVDRRPSFSIISPGTVLNTLAAIRHDELFFSYSAEVSEKLKAVFDPLPPERKSFKFELNEKFERDLRDIRSLLNARMTPGTADKLDAQAMEMTLFMAADAGSAGASQESLKAENKMQELAEKLRHGASLETLIRQYGYSRRRFYYEWNRFYSVSPKQTQLEAKLQKAQGLLLGSALSVAEIAQACGFSSHRYFHECFQRHHLCTPGEYRKMYKAPR